MTTHGIDHGAKVVLTLRHAGFGDFPPLPF